MTRTKHSIAALVLIAQTNFATAGVDDIKRDKPNHPQISESADETLPTGGSNGLIVQSQALLQANNDAVILTNTDLSIQNETSVSTSRTGIDAISQNMSNGTVNADTLAGKNSENEGRIQALESITTPEPFDPFEGCFWSRTNSGYTKTTAYPTSNPMTCNVYIADHSVTLRKSTQKDSSDRYRTETYKCKCY